MSTLQIAKSTLHNGDLILVNKDNPIHADYAVTAFSTVNDDYPEILIAERPAENIQALMNEMQAKDMIVPVSGYRTLDEQINIVKDCLLNEGEEYTRKFVANPNCSEHQTGYAIDLGIKSDKIDYICPDFPYEGICQKFREAAPYYGFIQRYSKEKEELTGISCEPWHFRFVGFPHSLIMTENKMALEEYLDYLKGKGMKGEHLEYKTRDASYDILWIRFDHAKELSIKVPNHSTIHISGDNAQGVVVTLGKTYSLKADIV